MDRTPAAPESTGRSERKSMREVDGGSDAVDPALRPERMEEEQLRFYQIASSAEQNSSPHGRPRTIHGARSGPVVGGDVATLPAKLRLATIHILEGEAKRISSFGWPEPRIEARLRRIRSTWRWPVDDTEIELAVRWLLAPEKRLA